MISNDPGQGLASGELDDCHVLIWWGHVRQAEITPQTGRSIVQRIKDGKLSLIALHSAHWSTPFVEAMNERTRLRNRREGPEPLVTTGSRSTTRAFSPPIRSRKRRLHLVRLTPYVS